METEKEVFEGEGATLAGKSPMMRSISILHRSLCAALLLLAALTSPSVAHNGAVAIAVPVEGIVVDGQFDDWPEGVQRWPVNRAEAGDRPKSAADYAGNFRVGYNVAEGTLYLALEMTDESVRIDPAGRWKQDGCEVYVETAHGEQGSPRQYRVRGETPGMGRADGLEDAELGLRREAGTHRYEWRIPVQSPDLGAGTILGLDVVLVDWDEDDSYSWMSWGPHASKSESAGVGDVLLAGDTTDLALVEGQLQTQGGAAAAGRKVRIALPNGQLLEVRTDAEGQYAVRLPAGAYTLEPGAGRGEGTQVSVNLGPGETVRADLVLPRPAGVRVEAGPGSARQAGPGRTTYRGPGVWRGSWHSLNISDGLADPSVTAITQDGLGRMWFATQGGASRYDGEQFVTFTAADGLGGNTLSSVAVDDVGNVWFGGSDEGGLTRYDGEQFVTFTTADGLPDDNVLALLPGADGVLWIGTSAGLCHYDGESFTTFTSEDGLPVDQVWSLVEDRAGNLWIGTEGGVARYDGEQFRVFTHEDGGPTSAVLSIASDPSGVIWFAAWGSGLASYDGHRFTSYTASDGLASNLALAVLSGSDGTLWVGTRQGVSRFDGENFVTFTPQDGLAHLFVMSIYEDLEGDLWFGTGVEVPDGGAAGDGVSRYAGRELTTFTTREGLVADQVMSIGQDEAGHMWFGTWGAASRYDGEQFETADVTGSAWGIFTDHRGDVWLGTRGSGLYRCRGLACERFSRQETGFSPFAFAIAEDASGALWFGSDGQGLTRFDGQSFSRVDDPPGLLSDLLLTALAFDDQGDLWIGTTRDGIFRYDGQKVARGPFEDEARLLRISAIQKDTKGRMWFATYGAGVGVYDGEGIRTLTTGDGLAHDQVNHIMQDRRGHLWFSTHGGGVSRYDGLVFQTLTKADGLPQNAVQETFEDRDGNVWIATEGGVTRFTPSRHPPGIRLTNVIADRELGAPEQVTVSSPQPLLAFEFRGSSFRTRSGQLAYLYRLSGLDEEWHLTREHRVVYRDLPRGDYIFEVKAVDRDLNYSAPLTVAVTVTPAYGQIALIGALGISMLGLAVAARYGVRRRRELDRARQELVRERRQRIEVQPHEIEHWTLDDFVGSSGSLQSVLSRSRDLQRDDSRTLIVGEAGTGKELVARAIHAGSRRADHAFVPVRCAGLPRQVESLTRRTEALSTLFGHTKGAFPGAEEDRQGLLQQAQGGTLFFDEVGLLPLPLQAHLLRVLTQGEVRRTGATESERLDVRVLAGTSEDLEMQVEVGGFSRELYEYLAAHLVTVPPLRDRLEDIEPLAQQIADSASRELGLESAPVSDEVLALLQGYGFPGNVRQLRRILEQALRTSRGPINTEDISLQA